MREASTELTRFDDWLHDDSNLAALVMRQWFQPAEGKDAVVFPASYADPDRAEPDGKPVYSIDRLDGLTVCQIDSVGSQANRMEPVFKRPAYRHLVPQVTVKAGKREISILDAGHRAADAILRFAPPLNGLLFAAFQAYQSGDAGPLAKIAPTSIVFGAWDSRATQAKLPRIVRSVIRAYDVRQLHRSAQYSTIAGEILEGGDAEVATKGPKSQLGLAHVPVRSLGGVQVLGDIRRDAILSLSPLRALAAISAEQTMALRRYILGLALVSITAPLDFRLREGCELVLDPDRKPEWQLVSYDGGRHESFVSHAQATAFATVAAAAFGVADASTGVFSPELAQDVLALSKPERDTLLRKAAPTPEALASVTKKRQGKAKNSAQAGTEE